MDYGIMRYRSFRYQNVVPSESTQCRKYRSTIPASSGPAGIFPIPA